MIEVLKEKFSRYNNFYVTNTESLSVAQVGNLRRVCFNKHVEMKVAKNTLIRKALEALDAILRAAPQLYALQIAGLMAIPPFTDDPGGARPYFRRLRELRDQVARLKLPQVQMAVLSMGMTHDFEVAIEEGSTRVRIGTAIFGPRPTQP